MTVSPSLLNATAEALARQSGSEVIKESCSAAELSMEFFMEFFLLVNIKMPTLLLYDGKSEFTQYDSRSSWTAIWVRDYKKIMLSSAQLSMEFFLLVNIKMPTFVGILTFMTRKNCFLSISEPEKS